MTKELKVSAAGYEKVVDPQASEISFVSSTEVATQSSLNSAVLADVVGIPCSRQEAMGCDLTHPVARMRAVKQWISSKIHVKRLISALYIYILIWNFSI